MKRIGQKAALEEIEKAMMAPRKDHKIRITTMLDGDILDRLKEVADSEKVKYQTLLNNILRDALFKKNSNSIESRLEKLEELFSKRKKSA
jgi:uncharacterized protein (DUF4415 family)